MAQMTPGRRRSNGHPATTTTTAYDQDAARPGADDGVYFDDFDDYADEGERGDEYGEPDADMGEMMDDDVDEYASVDGEPPIISAKQSAVRIGDGATGATPPDGARAVQTTLAWGVVLALLLAVMVGVIEHAALTPPIGPARASSALTTASNVIRVNSAVSAGIGQSPAVTAQAAFLFDPTTGVLYYSKNADVELPQASCTKVMTLLLAVERGNLNQMVTVGADAHALVNPNSSYMGLDIGEKLTLRDLLYGLVMPSGNDAAVAIADAIGGSVPNFVALMNQRAQQLGLTHTHFANPHGLDAPGHYTTARDLAVLSAYALRNPTIEQITSAYSYAIPQTATHKAYHLVTGNDLLPFARAPYPGAIGVKPGFTGNAGYCMSFAAIRRGHLLVGAVLNDPSWQVRIVDMRTLLDWGYQQYGMPAAPSPTPGENPSPNE